MEYLKFKWYRFLWWFVGKTKIPLKSPIHIDIELNSDCQLRCVMCPYSTTYEQRGFMPDKMARQAIREAGRLGIKSIKYQFRGEPGLNKNLEKYVELSSQYGFVDKFLNTNGLAFSKQRIQALAKAGITRVIISADGATKETYEKIRVRASWETLRRNFKWFVEAGHKVLVQMTIMSENENEVENFKHIWPGAKVKTNKVRSVGNIRAHCPQPYRRLIIGYDAKVYGCCNSWNNEFPVGDYKKQSIPEIWRGDRMKMLRKHAKNGTGPCKTCTIREAWKS